MLALVLLPFHSQQIFFFLFLQKDSTTGSQIPNLVPSSPHHQRFDNTRPSGGGPFTPAAGNCCGQSEGREAIF